MIKFNHNDMSGWSVMPLDPERQGFSTYELFRIMHDESEFTYFYQADLLMDAYALASAREKDEYAWMPRCTGTQLRRLVDEEDNEYINHVLETWPNEVKLFLIRKTSSDRWMIYRLKPATENTARMMHHDRELIFDADMHRTKRSLNWYKSIGYKLTKENKAELDAIRETIGELIMQQYYIGKETPSDA